MAAIWLWQNRSWLHKIVFLDFGFGFYTTLKVKKLYNQLVLTSEKALAHLRYIRSLQGEELG